MLGTKKPVVPPNRNVPSRPLPQNPRALSKPRQMLNIPPKPNKPLPTIPGQIPAAPPLPGPTDLTLARLEREIAHCAKELDRFHQQVLEALGSLQLSHAIQQYQAEAKTADQKMREYDRLTK